MKSFIKGKAAGFYLLLSAFVLTAAACIYYVVWGSANYALNQVVVIGLAAGIALNILLLFIDSDYLIIAITTLYSIGLFQLLADNMGSFADAYQGIVMFGDPTQVGAVLTIAILILACILAVITSGFMNRKSA